MDLSTAFTQINWFSVIVATLAAFALGSLWYSPVLVGKAWQTESKLSNEDIQEANMPLIFGTSFILNFIAALVLDMFLGKDATLVYGLIAGLLVALAWIATAFGTSYLFSRKSFKLYLIDAGYYVFYYGIMGIILGAWK
jgi:hypothetical protein